MGTDIGNITLGIDALFKPTFEYLGVKLRDYVKSRFERDAALDLWGFYPAIAYYIHFIVPICYSLKNGAIIKLPDNEYVLDANRNKLQLFFPTHPYTDHRLIPSDCVQAIIECKSHRRMPVLFNPSMGFLIDIPSMFSHLQELNKYLNLDAAVFGNSLVHARGIFIQQIMDLLAHDEENKLLVLIQSPETNSISLPNQ